MEKNKLRSGNLVLDWVERYQEMGVAGLEDWRGKRLASQTPRTTEDTLRIENARLEADNVLNRQFYADKPNEKWLTDVAEFKYYVGPSVHKLYLSAILVLCDRRIVSFVLRDANDSALVHETLNQALAASPDARPLFHSGRDVQYTIRVFHGKLAAAEMTQSMSRVGKCIDNGPIEGFRGILKRERYYGRKFTSREQLSQIIREYIVYYNFSRLQRRLGIHTPLEVCTQSRAV